MPGQSSTFPAGDGTTLHEIRWTPPSGTPSRSVVVLVHGYGEHIARYEHVGEALAKAGFTVVGADLRGHGASGGTRGFCNSFAEYLDDLALLIGRNTAAGTPPLLLGHSFGGLISTRFVLERPTATKALALSSPFFALKLAVPKVKVLAARAASTIYPKLALPSGLRGADVSRDPVEIQKYDSDPLNNKNATARWFTETSRTQEEVFARAGEIRVPVLALHGGGDRIADPQRTEALMGRVTSDKTHETLPGQFHEIFNEPAEDRAVTISRFKDWLLQKA
jgi:lysophospholipase